MRNHSVREMYDGAKDIGVDDTHVNQIFDCRGNVLGHAAFCKLLRVGGQCFQREIDDHNLAHCPYRGWCEGLRAANPRMIATGQSLAWTRTHQLRESALTASAQRSQGPGE